MTDLPIPGEPTNPSVTEGQFKTYLDDWLEATRELPGSVSRTSLTISTGVITPTSGVHIIDTEGATPSDDLTNISTANVKDGGLLYLRIASNARVVTLRNASGTAGQFFLASGEDFVMNDTSNHVLFQRVGSNWEEISAFGTQPPTAGVLSTNYIVGSADLSVELPSGVIPAGEFVEINVPVIGAVFGLHAVTFLRVPSSEHEIVRYGVVTANNQVIVTLSNRKLQDITGLVGILEVGVSAIAPSGAIDDNAIHDNVPDEINQLSEKVTPANTDLVIIEDSENNNEKAKVQLGNLSGSGSETNISIVESPTGVEVQSSSGTNDVIDGANNTNAGVMLPADKIKLDGIEAGATADQTGAEIKAAYEAEADTNAFTDAEKTLLGNQSGINTGDEPQATVDLIGVVELATSSETIGGISGTHATTPAGVKSAYYNKTEMDAALAAKTDLDLPDLEHAGAAVAYSALNRENMNRFTNAAAKTLTIGTGEGQGVGHLCNFVNGGAGDLTVAGSGVTLISLGNMFEQNALGTIWFRTTTEAWVFGGKAS